MTHLLGVPLRVAIVAESFIPEINGVTNSVLRVVDHLADRGHEVLVIAPGDGPTQVGTTPVARVRAVGMPLYRQLKVGLPTADVRAQLHDFGPDVVHLAAPALLGLAGVRAAKELDVPSVAIFQTDLVGFATRYHLTGASPALRWWLRRIHNQASITLAPSTATAWALRANGIERVGLWPRGVDAERFSPTHAHDALRRRLSPDGRPIVGYVGRLAREKQVELLAPIDRMPDIQTVVIGDGPARRRLESALPNTTFLGFQQGHALSRAVASLDVFVHTGAHETFCQAVQESLAAGVPVVAPAAGGPLDLVRHGVTGYLYPPGDQAHLAEAVRTLATQPALHNRMSEAGRASVEHRRWPRVLDDLLRVYRRVGAERAGARRRAA